jgi:hypothetical protein
MQNNTICKSSSRAEVVGLEGEVVWSCGCGGVIGGWGMNPGPRGDLPQGHPAVLSSLPWPGSWLQWPREAERAAR